jgi:hypothetical protein
MVLTAPLWSGTGSHLTQDYPIDVKRFVQWMAIQNLSFISTKRDELIAHRSSQTNDSLPTRLI